LHLDARGDKSLFERVCHRDRRVDLLALKGGIKLMRLVFLFATLALISWSQGSAPVPDALRKTHDALFASFLPTDEIRQDADLSLRFSAARDRIWDIASQAAQFRQLLAPFNDLRAFGPACGMSVT